jgi:hypothetical protein
MNLSLIRSSRTEDGVFGHFIDDDKNILFATLEHPYRIGGSWVSKVPKGEYVCVRGIHQLAHMDEPFEAFEITGVIGHTDILIHVGNYASDSDGCILVGIYSTLKMICQSKAAFSAFMTIQEDCDQFNLSVIS